MTIYVITLIKKSVSYVGVHEDNSHDQIRRVDVNSDFIRGVINNLGDKRPISGKIKNSINLINEVGRNYFDAHQRIL
jgi:hypothetical protein